MFPDMNPSIVLSYFKRLNTVLISWLKIQIVFTFRFGTVSILADVGNIISISSGKIYICQ